MTHHTRRLYAFDCRFEFTPRLRREHQMEWLRAVATFIWGCENGKGPAPQVVATDKTVSSYFNGRIELARHQRCLAVLIHELAHALGNDREYDHGPAFCRRYFRLLADHGGARESDIEFMAKVVGIK